MLHTLLPLISVALGLSAPAPALGEEPVTVTTPRTAQVRLAVTLAEADAIHAIRRDPKRATITFAIDRDGEAFDVVATTRARGRHQGEVVALSIVDAGPALGDVGSLSWLGAELADATAITRLVVDEDGAVTITTSEGHAYMAIPGRGSGGNAAVEARWAAAWSSDDA